MECVEYSRLRISISLPLTANLGLQCLERTCVLAWLMSKATRFGMARKFAVKVCIISISIRPSENAECVWRVCRRSQSVV